MNRWSAALHVLILSIHLAKGDLAVSFLETRVTYDTAYLSNHTVQINSDRTSLRILLAVAQDYELDPWVQFKVYQVVAKTQQYKHAIDYDLNICQLLGKTQSAGGINLFQIFLNNFLKYGTLPKSCPIRKGTYHWRRMKVLKGTVPPFVALGKYVAEVITYFRLDAAGKQRRRIANVTTWLQIRAEK